MELKLFHIWHLKSGAKFQKLLKWARPYDLLNQKYKNGNQNVIAAFAQHICTMLVLLMFFSFFILVSLIFSVIYKYVLNYKFL